MTQLSEKDHAAQMADMKSFDEQITELIEREFSLPYFEFVYEPMEQVSGE